MHLHLWLRLGIVQASLASALALHKRSYEKRGISHIFHRKNVRFCTFSIGKQRFRGYGGRCLHVRRANANFAVQKKNDVKGIDLNTPATRQENHSYLYL